MRRVVAGKKGLERGSHRQITGKCDLTGRNSDGVLAGVHDWIGQARPRSQKKKVWENFDRGSTCTACGPDEDVEFHT